MTEEVRIEKSPRTEPAIQAVWVIALFLLHAGMGIAFGKASVLAVVHALGTGAVALACAVTDRSLVRTAYVAAYIAGSEAAWRICGANLVWEFAKYTTVGSMMLALVLHGKLRPHWAAILYLGALIPSGLLTFTMTDPPRARQLVSFDLSGPISLAASVVFFNQVRLTGHQLARVLLAYIIPSLAVVGIIALGLATTEVTFRSSSLAAASGGFGPNQISAALGLAGMLAFLVTISRQVPLLLRIVTGALILVFAAQSALTFSRCGLYYLVGGIAIASVILMRNPRTAIQLGFIALILGLGVYFVVYPALDDFTEGALSRRFSNTDLTNRDKIMRMDLEIFMENPALGIGVGRGKEVRETMEHRAASHTEYTRLLAEHGSLGIIALVLLFWMGGSHYLRASGVPARAITAAMLSYTYLYMIANGMRQVLPALTFGIATAWLFYKPRPKSKVEAPASSSTDPLLPNPSLGPETPKLS